MNLVVSGEAEEKENLIAAFEYLIWCMFYLDYRAAAFLCRFAFSWSCFGTLYTVAILCLQLQIQYQIEISMRAISAFKHVQIVKR